MKSNGEKIRIIGKEKRLAEEGRIKGRRKGREKISTRKIGEFCSGVRARVDKADAVFVYILLFSFEVLVEKR